MELLNKNQNKETLIMHKNIARVLSFWYFVLFWNEKKNQMSFYEIHSELQVLVTSVFYLLWQFSDIFLFWDF